MSLKLTDVGYSHGRLPILSDLSLDIEEGEWLAVVGGNGSGRSTLAQIAAGLRRPQSGHVLLEGHNLWSKGGRLARRHVGLVMQRAEDQFLGQTVFDDIAFGPRQYTQDSDAIEQSVRRALAQVDFDMDDVGPRSPLHFSGGQRRRLAVAGILALSPSVLILDEPFAGLDHEARAGMALLLDRLIERQSITVFTLTSQVELVFQASRMALLHQGQIAFAGNLADFVANQALCREAGVLMPEPIRLSLALRERGWSVPILGSEGALEAAVAREWRQRKRA